MYGSAIVDGAGADKSPLYIRTIFWRTRSATCQPRATPLCTIACRSRSIPRSAEIGTPIAVRVELVIATR
jgi:hypothetical protein